MTGTIYLMHVYEYIECNQNVYKIGKTHRNVNTRLSEYPKGTLLKYCIAFEDHHQAEKDLITIFQYKFKLYDGKEYFEGNLDEMIHEIINYKNLEHIMLKYRIKDKNKITPEDAKILEEKLLIMLAIDNDGIISVHDDDKDFCVINDLNNKSLWFICDKSIYSFGTRKAVKQYYELYGNERQLYIINLKQIERSKQLSMLKTGCYNTKNIEEYFDNFDKKYPQLRQGYFLSTTPRIF